MQVKSWWSRNMMAGGWDNVGSDAIQQLGAFVSPSQFHWTRGKMGEKCEQRLFKTIFIFQHCRWGMNTIYLWFYEFWMITRDGLAKIISMTSQRNELNIGHNYIHSSTVVRLPWSAFLQLSVHQQRHHTSSSHITSSHWSNPQSTTFISFLWLQMQDFKMKEGICRRCILSASVDLCGIPLWKQHITQRHSQTPFFR